MSKSHRLRVGQVRAAFRLVGECRDLGHDPDAWPARLAAGLPALVASQMVLAGEFDYSGSRPLPVRVVEAGWPSERSRAFWLSWVQNPALPEHPGLAAFAAKPARRGAWTRPELVADRDWEASPHINEVLRPAGIDEGMLSGVPTPGGRDHLLIAARVCGDRAFTGRDRALLHLLHAELAPHLGRGLATSDDPAAALTPRLREVLTCLLDGDPEKRIARRLRVTPATLHGYVKQVYRAFGVGSRAELMAHFLRRYRRPGG